MASNWNYNWNGRLFNDEWVIRKKSISAIDYSAICAIIRNFRGAPSDCAEVLNLKFDSIRRDTLRSILDTKRRNRMFILFQQLMQNGHQFLERYDREAARVDCRDCHILLRMSFEENMNPTIMSRIILTFKYGTKTNEEISNFLKYPVLIDDDILKSNVFVCVNLDKEDIIKNSLERVSLGIRYELKAFGLARTAGMRLFDEHMFRNLNIRKIPSLLLAIPIVYKGNEVNWIESEPSFGDPKSHKYNMEHRLYDYTISFGPGIIIYWYGCHEDTPRLQENGTSVFVLDGFPTSSDLELVPGKSIEFSP